MIIAIDFDGTCVTHEFPNVGKDIGAQNVLKKLVDKGHLLILNTMRSEGNGLEDALLWFSKNEIPLWGINENPKQSAWTKSPKVYANYYIDDAALGAPLILDANLSDKPFINWRKIEAILDFKNLI